jgi:RNA-directed DNA polymerase
VVQDVLAELGLELHPDKTRIVELREGRDGFDFLRCHFQARVSGKLLELGKRRNYLQRWPSVRSMKRMRSRIRDLTGRHRNGVKDIRVIIRDLNPVLRGWGNYFRTGNVALKFTELDWYVVDRLRRFLRKRYGRFLKPGQFRHGHGSGSRDTACTDYVALFVIRDLRNHV